MCECWLGLVARGFGGDCCHDCFMVTEGEVSGSLDGPNLADNLSGAAYVV